MAATRYISQHLLALVLYVFIFICGFIMTITLGTTKTYFDGNCPLYMHITWSPNFRGFRISGYGSDSTCDYVAYVPILTCILYPFIMLLFYGYVNLQIYMGNKSATDIIQLNPLLAVNGVCFFLTFVSACIITTGRRYMCSSFLDRELLSNASCYDAENWDWPRQSFRPRNSIRNIVMGEATTWICLLWWILLILLHVKEFLRLRKERLGMSAENKDEAVEKMQKPSPRF